MPSSSVTILSKTTVRPSRPSSVSALKLSVSDLPMLSCHYIQKGVLLPPPPSSLSSHQLFDSLQSALSFTLSFFPPLAGRLLTDPSGHISISCSDAGVDFLAASAKHLAVGCLLPPDRDVPAFFREFFAYHRLVSHEGHKRPLVAVQVTELADGVFVGCTANHAVVDGTSFWQFFNTFADVTAGAVKIANAPEFTRDTVFDSPAVLRVPPGGPRVTFDADAPLRERIFHFSREAILKLKHRANNGSKLVNGESNGKVTSVWSKNCGTNGVRRTDEISSFQSLCAQLWRSVTKARELDPSKTTTFRMAVNCRHRLEPKLDPYYFGNAIQSIPTFAPVGELLANDLRWCADLLHRNVVAYDDGTVRSRIKDWEREPRLFPLGNPDGASITMGSSPRFPMYDNDFGWGRPLAVRSGGANKFDGKISAFPTREGDGGVDLEVVLAPETMAGIEKDPEFMQYVTTTRTTAKMTTTPPP